MKISYLQYEDINKEKWDHCIDTAPNGLIYAYPFYLDAMSKNWSALVANDYEIVMPLTWNRKFGVSYLRQPAFTQQSGLFGNIPFTENVTEEFLNKALKLFPFAEINLNYANEYKKGTTERCNLILPLNNSFAEIEKSFKNDLKKNIKKANKNSLIYTSSEEIENAIESYRNIYSAKLHTSQKDYENFRKLCFILKEKEQLLVRKVNSKDEQLLAIAIFFKDKKRIYNIMSTTFSEGRSMEANHFLLHELIKEFSGQNLILDFEGSEIPSINFFYRKFGAIEQPYPFVRINNLNRLQRFFKNLSDHYKFSKRN
ncbi:MAG TPA: GNAT family N-acetyltransferase [Ginsengibacter sp.]|nr:GNAT family N-acetyltransferase [Ginsengibacter sp.]